MTLFLFLDENNKSFIVSCPSSFLEVGINVCVCLCVSVCLCVCMQGEHSILAVLWCLKNVKRTPMSFPCVVLEGPSFF